MTWNILNKKKLIIWWDKDFYWKNWRWYKWLAKYFIIKTLEPKQTSIHIGKTISLKHNNKKISLKWYDMALITKCQWKYSEMLQTIIHYCKNSEIAVFQEEFLAKRAGKISVYRLLQKIWLWNRVIPTTIKLEHDNTMRDNLLIKDTFGYKWQNIKLYKNDDSEDLLDKLIQPFITNTWDIRILVLWGEILCAYKRKGQGWLTNNISQWGSSSQFNALPFMKKEVKIIAEKLWLEWFWVDYIQDDISKKRYILEINIMPGTEGTMKILKEPVYEILGSYLYNHC